MKDAKGHGSDKRGGVGDFSRQQLLANYATMHGTAAATKAAARLPVDRPDVKMTGQAHVARIAQAHNITGGPFKVQALDTSRAGKPWATAKSYKNRTVAERVAQGMRQDGGYTRVRTK